MNNFILQSPTELIFGKGQVAKLGKKVKEYGNKILLVTGQGSIKRIGLYDKIIKYLKEENLNIFELSGVEPNPRIDLVREGIKLCKNNNIDFVLAAGGGSTIDTGKTIAAGVYYPNDPWEMIKEKNDPKKALPLGCVLTMAATGSEMNGNAVISNLETKEKLAIQTLAVIPKFSILDPEYTTTVPKDQSVFGIVDIAVHVLEQYFSKTENTPIQDRWAESILITLREESQKLLEDLNDYQARANIMLSATLALNGGVYRTGGEYSYLLSMGKINDFASHKIEHELSAIYDIPHGAGLAIIYPNWMKCVFESGLEKFIQYAQRVFAVDPKGKTNKEIALEGINKTRQWFDDMGAPKSLAYYNIDDSNFQLMAKKACANGEIGNYKKLNEKDVYKILKLSL